jgi:hypothetical protein
MKTNVEVKSNLFPACRNCRPAVNLGLEKIVETLNQKADYTPPSEDSVFDATVTCAFNTGVQLPGSHIVYEAEVKVNGEFFASETGPMNLCPPWYMPQVGHYH